MAGERGDPADRLMASSPSGTYPYHGVFRAKGCDRGKEHDYFASTRAGSLGSAGRKNRSSASLSLALLRDQPPRPLRRGLS